MSQPPASKPFALCPPGPLSLQTTSTQVDAHGPSYINWLFSLPLAPARCNLLTCSQSLDLYLCTLQPVSLGTAPQGLREDVWSMSKPRAWDWTCILVEGWRGMVRFWDKGRTEP
jgi:hypothetical protein